MTRKEYVKIANTFIKCINEGRRDGTTDLAMRFIGEMADMLHMDNPRFDSSRFSKYITDRIGEVK